MRTMACVWFTVILLIGAQEVFGNVCQEKKPSSLSCDECIRCGGKWCSQTGNVGCSLSADDSWCPNHRETVHPIPEVGEPGDLISPIYAERSVLVGSTSTIKLVYASKTKLEVKIEILNSTQNQNIFGEIREVDSDFECQGMNCSTAIQASPTWGFCSNSGSTHEFVYVKVTIGKLGQPAVIKYHVPCACECSKEVGPSQKCSGHGNYTCGSCKCDNGWTGSKCDQENCRERGDATPLCMNNVNGQYCSGNGRYDHCNVCQCNMSLEGSQYFEEECCGDLCMSVNDCSECTDCIYNSTMSQCSRVAFEGNSNNLNILNKNDTSLDERDDMNRKKWVKCKMVLKDCDISYMAKREENGELYVTVMESCNDVIAGAYTPAPTVSIVLGALAALAAVVAVAGVMIWKHMNALPPVPLNGAGYSDINAEDCVGENPLYKPPTSNFNNPIYGKW